MLASQKLGSAEPSSYVSNRARPAPQISQDLWEFRHRFPRANLRFARARKIGFVSQKSIGAGSHRFCFGGFRRRTPGPPPFSSMNSTPAETGTAKFNAKVFEPEKLGSFWQKAVGCSPLRS
jgi:hypothetical protein